MIRTVITAIALAAVCVTAAAQTEQAYIGQITGEDVFVRSGPNQNHYPIMKLPQGSKVTVLGRERGWLTIAQPKKVYSLLAKPYVKVEGSVGTVTGDRVNVRAGSYEYPTRWSRIQCRLNTGDKVTLVGETEEHYKIIPPADVVVYVSPAYVKPADAATEPAVEVASAATTQPATQPAVTRPVVEPASAQEAMVASTKAFKAAEKALEAEWAKPADQRDLVKLRAMYRSVKAPSDHPLAAKVAYRLRYLEFIAQKHRGAAEVAKLAVAQKSQREQLAAKRAQLAGAPQPATAVGPFMLTGRLTPSRIYLGDGVAPKRFLVKDIDTGMTLAYAQAGAGVNLGAFAGVRVSLAGKRVYSSAQRAYIIEVTSVRKLPAGVVTPAPAAIKRPARVTQKVNSFPMPWPKPSAPADAATTIDENVAVGPLPTTGLPMTPATEAAPDDVNPEEYK